MRALPYCVRNDLALVIKISLILAVADIRDAPPPVLPLNQNAAIRRESYKFGTVVLPIEPAYPVVNQLVVDVGNRHSPIVIDVVDQVVLELGQVTTPS